MADVDPFEAALQQVEQELQVESAALAAPPQQAPQQAQPPSQPPITDVAQQDVFSELNARHAQREAAFIEANQAPGVPLDTREGADLLTRLKVGLHRNKQDQLDVLRRIYGPDAVRVSPEGDFIARISDGEKGTRDITVDERDLTFRDWADLASELPAFGLSLLTTKGVPVKDLLRMAVRGAAGYAVGGIATDVAARATSEPPLNLDEVLSTRLKGVAQDAALGFGLGVAGSAGLGVLRMARGGASALGEATAGAMADIEQARQRVKGSTGVELQPTLAELSGNPMLRRVETFLSNIPGARGVILRKWAKEIENEKAVMEAMGVREVPDLGERLITQLQKEPQAAQAALDTAATAVRSEAEGALTGPLQAIAGRPISTHSFGTRMIRRGEAQLQNFKQTARDLYSKVRAEPAFTQPLFDVSPIQMKALQIQDELLKTGQGDVAKGLAPAGILPVLKDVDSLSSTASYFDLQKLREAIYDRMDSPSEPISDRGTKLLKELGASVTAEMESQGPKVAGPAWKLVKEANQYYRDKVETFYQKGILGMLKPRTEAGALDPERIASSLLAGGKGSVTTYNTLEQFFEKPQALADMNRLLRDRVLAQGTDSATGLVRLEDLAEAVNKLEPEIVQRLFKVPKPQLMSAVQEGQLALRTTGKSGAVAQKGTQEAVELDAFKQLLDSGNIKSAAVRDLAQAANRARTAYTGTINQAIKADDVGVIAAAPETFGRDYLFNPTTPMRDVVKAMDTVYRSGDSQLIGDVRRAYLHEVLSSAFKKQADPVDVTARIRGSLQEIDPQKLSLKFQSGVDQDRMRTILGPDAYGQLKDFALAIGGRAGREVGAGQLVGGGLIAGLLTGLKGLPDLAAYYVVSHALTSPRTLSALRQVEKLAPERLEGMVRSLVLTPEFYKTIVADAPTPEEARAVTTAVQQWGQQQPQQ